MIIRKRKSPPHTPFKGKRTTAKKDALARVQELFDEFWAAYPAYGSRKTDKRKCLTKLTKYLNESNEPKALFSRIMSGLKNWKQSTDWHDGFICAPLVWLNNERWDAEIAPVKAKSVSAFERIESENAARIKARGELAERLLAESIAEAAREGGVR